VSIVKLVSQWLVVLGIASEMVQGMIHPGHLLGWPEGLLEAPDRVIESYQAVLLVGVKMSHSA